MGDIDRIQGIAEMAGGKVGDELTFPFPEVLRVIGLCSTNQIAVLGVELFLVWPDGYHVSGNFGL
jgi:hypothetical protein